MHFMKNNFRNIEIICKLIGNEFKHAELEPMIETN